MTAQTLLQLFLLADTFAAGVLVTLAARHARAHFRPETHDAEHRAARTHTTAQGAHLPPAVRRELLAKAESRFEHVLEQSGLQLQRDLQAITTRLDRQLERVATEIIKDETTRYREDIDRLRQEAEVTLTQAQAEVTGHQAALRQRIEQEEARLRAQLSADIEAERQAATGAIAAEKERLKQQLDSRLSDAVAAFLLETLGNNVDLGAQEAYLISMLEEHKAELTRRAYDG